MWDVATGAAPSRGRSDFLIRRLNLAISGDERSLAIASPERFTVFDLPNPACIRRSTFTTGRLGDLALSSDGAYLLMAGWDRVLRMYDLSTGNPVRAMEGHQGGINAMEVTPQITAAVTASQYDNTLRFWDWRRARQYVSQTASIEQARETLSHTRCEQLRGSLAQLWASGTPSAGPTNGPWNSLGKNATRGAIRFRPSRLADCQNANWAIQRRPPACSTIAACQRFDRERQKLYPAPPAGD